MSISNDQIYLYLKNLKISLLAFDFIESNYYAIDQALVLVMFAMDLEFKSSETHLKNEKGHDLLLQEYWRNELEYFGFEN
jgi:hypothetical protein